MTKIILALAFATACAVDDGPGICLPPDTPVDGELPAVDGVDAFPCVVRIRLEGQGSHGSGVVIGDRTVLTASHVVEGAGLVYVSGLDVDDRVGRSGTFARHPTMDLAVIHFSRDLDLPIAELSGLPAESLIGRPHTTAGFGSFGLDMAGTVRTVVSGVIAGVDIDDQVLTGLEQPSFAGSSGGGVFSRGELVGIHLGRRTIDGVVHGRELDVFAASYWIEKNIK